MKSPAKSYLTKHGLASSHWGKRIIAAEKRGWFTCLNKDRALGWTTCACGKLDKRIPRDKDRAPWDGKLKSVGCKFYSCVKHNRMLQSAQTLVAIEKRAAQILKKGDL